MHTHRNSSDAVATIGVDIGKNTFHLVGLDKRGAIVLRIKVSRSQLERRLANVPCFLVGMEAGCGSHQKRPTISRSPWPSPREMGNTVPPNATNLSTCTVQSSRLGGLMKTAWLFGAILICAFRSFAHSTRAYSRTNDKSIAVPLARRFLLVMGL